MLGYQHHIQKLVLFHRSYIIMWARFVAPFITDTYRTSVHLFLISALCTTLFQYYSWVYYHCSLYWSCICTSKTEVFKCESLLCSLSRSELLFSISTAGLFEQGQASQHLGHWQFSMDLVVPRAHIDTVSHLLLLSDHCQDMRMPNSLTWAKSHQTHAQLP